MPRHAETIRQGMEGGIVGEIRRNRWTSSESLGIFTSLANQRSIAIVDDDPGFLHNPGRHPAPAGVRRNAYDLSTYRRGPDGFQLPDDLAGYEVEQCKRPGFAEEYQAALPGPARVAGYQLSPGDGGEYPGGDGVSTPSPVLYKPLEIPDLLEKLSSIQLGRLRSAIDGN